MSAAAPSRSWLTTPGALRVPEVTVVFWVVKLLSTAMGEASSDYLVHAMPPELAVLLGFALFVVALVVQFRARRYVAATYWFAVVMVGLFGTMAADVLHVGLGVPYQATTVLYAVALAVIFFAWQRVEGTVSIHSIDTPRREAFYWAMVVATFAMGTALGDLTAYTLGLGYFPSALLFALLMLLPIGGYRLLRWSAVFSFWFAYVLTRPLGASLADGFGKPRSASGMDIGDGVVALVIGVVIVAIVAVLAVTKADEQTAPLADTVTPRPSGGGGI